MCLTAKNVDFAWYVFFRSHFSSLPPNARIKSWLRSPKEGQLLSKPFLAPVHHPVQLKDRALPKHENVFAAEGGRLKLQKAVIFLSHPRGCFGLFSFSPSSHLCQLLDAALDFSLLFPYEPTRSFLAITTRKRRGRLEKLGWIWVFREESPWQRWVGGGCSSAAAWLTSRRSVVRYKAHCHGNRIKSTLKLIFSYEKESNGNCVDVSFWFAVGVYVLQLSCLVLTGVLLWSNNNQVRNDRAS